jgi:glutamate dehydrogenase (NAD(P)+)
MVSGNYSIETESEEEYLTKPVLEEKLKTQKNELLEIVEQRFNKAADIINLDPKIRKILEKPTSEVVVNFPAKMDDGEIRMFTGYRVQHNDALGPFKGGIRFHQEATFDEIRAHAVLMTLKSAVANIHFGGAKGWLNIDPLAFSTGEMERITRRLTYALRNNIGPEYDILAPDINTNSQVMAWIQDTYLSMMPREQRNANIHIVTGKPLESGGSQGREKATAQGVVYCIEQWAADNNFMLDGASVIVQGYGSVGSWVSRLLKILGARIVAVEDLSGAIRNINGLDPDELYDWAQSNRGISGYHDSTSITHEAFLSTKADIFIPAALENQITSETAPMLDVKLVAEGANMPTDPGGDAVLHDKGITVLPDILCNSGGVIVSYFEWLQNKRNEFWDIQEVDSKLRKKIISAYIDVRDTAKMHKTDLRLSAVIVALTRIEKAYRDKDILP